MCVFLQHPFSILLAGPSGCGKTFFIAQLIEHCKTHIQPPIEKVVYVYHQYQDLFRQLRETHRAQTRLKPLIPLLRAKKKHQRQPRVINCLCEMVHNVLKGHVKLSRGQKQRWAHHKHKLRRLIAPKSNTAKRQKLIQKGGFLQLLIPLATQLLGGLFPQPQ